MSRILTAVNLLTTEGVAIKMSILLKEGFIIFFLVLPPIKFAGQKGRFSAN